MLESASFLTVDVKANFQPFGKQNLTSHKHWSTFLLQATLLEMDNLFKTQTIEKLLLQIETETNIK